MFSFAYEHTMVVVFLQKNDEGWEKPIALFRRSLRDVELIYNNLEK
jgi:hypothetical protein